MLKKTTIITILMILVVSMGVFAEGQNERPTRVKPQISEEEITLTGQIYLQNRIRPELKTGDKMYALLVPRIAALKLGIKDGEEITITGKIVEVVNPRSENQTSPFTPLLVISATVNGKTYEVKDSMPQRGKRPGRSSNFKKGGCRGAVCPMGTPGRALPKQEE